MSSRHPYVLNESDYREHMAIVAEICLTVVVAGCLVAVGARMLRRQQRIYQESDGPADLYRADESESGEPFDPKAPSQAAEDFFAAGANPQWMRGARDTSFSPHGSLTRPSSAGLPKVAGGQCATNSHEGWCADPFGRHEARWISNGSPTSLVRDGQVESHDPPEPQVAG